MSKQALEPNSFDLLFKDRSDEEISAFAYNIGRAVDAAIKKKARTNFSDTQRIWALIFDFRNKILVNGGLSDFTMLKKFDEHFGIESADPTKAG